MLNKTSPKEKPKSPTQLQTAKGDPNHLSQRYRKMIETIDSLHKELNTQKKPSLLAVSKKHSAESIRQLQKLGQRRFGENYCQEMTEKAERLADLDIEFVFIGKIQSNKISKIVSVAAEIQSLHSMKHAKLIEKAAKEQNKIPYPVYVEVNINKEISKAGLAPENLRTFVEQLTNECPQLDIQGIMALPDISKTESSLSPKEIPVSYRELYELSQKVGRRKLSLGTSQDLAIAIAAGSTEVRIGTALFGARSG